MQRQCAARSAQRGARICFGQAAQGPLRRGRARRAHVRGVLRFAAGGALPLHGRRRRRVPLPAYAGHRRGVRVRRLRVLGAGGDAGRARLRDAGLRFARADRAVGDDALGPNALGIYLHGSAVHGGLKPASDVDILVVSQQSLDHRNGAPSSTGSCRSPVRASGRGRSSSPSWFSPRCVPGATRRSATCCTATGCAPRSRRTALRSRSRCPTWPS